MGMIRWIADYSVYNLTPGACGFICTQSIHQCTPTLYSFITLHAIARGKTIGFFFCHLSSVFRTKFARSGDLGVWATHKYNISVDIVEKLASLCFKSFGKAHASASQILYFVGLSTLPTELSAHAHNLAQYAGKGLQQAAGMELSDINIDTAARGACAL